MKSTFGISALCVALAIAAAECVTQAQTNNAPPADAAPRAGLDAFQNAEGMRGGAPAGRRDGSGGRGGWLTQNQIQQLSGSITASTNLAALTAKLRAAEMDAVDAVLATNATDASVRAKLEVVAGIQTEIAMARYTTAVKTVVPTITADKKNTFEAARNPALANLIYNQLFVDPLGGPRAGGPGNGSLPMPLN